MAGTTFIVVGENIHCTRIYKVGGAFVSDPETGPAAIHYGTGADRRSMSVPDVFRESDAWRAGKVAHCAVAVWHGLHGTAADRAIAEDYIRFHAARQTQTGATFLDINVDEFSRDTDERIDAIRWVADVIQGQPGLPLSIDSSDLAVLRAGLEACDRSRGRPLLNSVSLERPAAIEVAVAFDACVIASAAGESDLPSDTEERMANFARLMPRLESAGLSRDRIYADPLVLPIATESRNGAMFLDAVAGVRQTYGPDIHILGGLSNVSFGMPERKLINQVFAWLAVERGADGGIVDPIQINGKILAALDPDSEPFRLARALLEGADMFGADYIEAFREGRLKTS